MSMQVQSSRDFVDVNGAQLAYQIAGEGHPLVLIHAGIVDSRMWDDQLDSFARRFTVIRYDVRGFGQSAIPVGPYSNRDDLFGLLRALGVDRAFVLGVSMGAKVALDFALEHPEMVDALVLVSAAVDGVPPSALSQQAYDEIDAVYEAGDLAGAVEPEVRCWVNGPRRSPDMVDPAVREKVREMDTYNFNRAGDEGEELLLHPPAADRLDEIRVPTLVIVGGEDVPDTLENGDRLVRGITGARKEVIHDAAHMLSMERPEEFNRFVIDFLRGLHESAG